MRLSNAEKAQFFSQLATLLQAGMSLQQSLMLVGEKIPRSFQTYLQKVSTKVGTGEDFASALGSDPSYFDSWTISLIRLAEYSGSLAQICEKLAAAATLEQRRKKLYHGIRWNAIATLWSLLTLIAALFNAHPPSLVQPGFWLRSFGLGLLLWSVSEFGAGYLNRALDTLGKNLPILGHLVEARSFLLLTELQLPLSCGVPVLTAIDLLREQIPQAKMSAILATASRKIRAGQSLTRSFAGKLPPLALQILQTGEETGNLDLAWEQLAVYYEEELARSLNLLNLILRPVSILAFGGLVAVVGIRSLSLLLNALPS